MTIQYVSRPQSRTWRVISVLAAGFLLIIAGCGESKPCVVLGTVLVDGNPTEGVYVVFHPIGGPVGRPESGTARSDRDGLFSLVVDPPGESAITAFWPKVTTKDGDTLEGADRFGGLYRDAQRPVSQVTVLTGDNVLPPIRLTRSQPGRSNVRGGR